jgi:hypothetical protein
MLTLHQGPRSAPTQNWALQLGECSKLGFYARAESQEPHSDMLTYMALFWLQVLGPIHRKECS